MEQREAHFNSDRYNLKCCFVNTGDMLVVVLTVN